ncbi:glucokinase [Cyanobacterium aponinum]|uniref:Glucokinase n=1 Tax=Cyanobacterium aponinum (strain PCC 10605) TaxID=755178 RepID=K9Z853_CYAAP|nr:glucokinase [Cyanobacterium aponinum]AFZ54912.1 glucokinase [Cyanobacterium aponinum PCC 10605]
MKVLIGDIGGTKTILRLVEINKNNHYETIKQIKYSSQEYQTFSYMIEKFLDGFAIDKICIAIAGPINNNSCKLTNLNWHIKGDELAQEFHCQEAYLLNDFAAVSYGIINLKESELFTLQEGEKNNNSPIAVIGAGTGLGQSFLIPEKNKYRVFATEGGHSDFSPKNELEWQLLKYLKNKFGWERISAERVISGQGIVAIYQFLRDTKFAPESEEISSQIKQWEQGDNTIDPGEIIGQSALTKSDILTTQTMTMFLDAYAGEIGNFALKILPYGGIYIAGGIITKILPLVQDSDFVNTFLHKGRMKPLLEKMPLKVVTNTEVALQGLLYYESIALSI